MTAPAAPAEAAAPVPTATEPLSKDARDKLIADAAKGFKQERDKTEGLTYYTVKDTPIYKHKLSTYISVPDQGPALLRVVLANQGKAWLNFDSMKATADDTMVLQKDFPAQQVQRGENAAGKFETTDFVALPTDVVALEKIADAKTVKIELVGKDRNTSFTLAKKAQQDLKSTLAAFAAMDGLKGK
ncbi:MAG TPA: hypothetical protein VIT92_03615 [Burkholderiaceae bacterium]